MSGIRNFGVQTIDFARGYMSVLVCGSMKIYSSKRKLEKTIVESPQKHSQIEPNAGEKHDHEKPASVSVRVLHT